MKKNLLIKVLMAGLLVLFITADAFAALLGGYINTVEERFVVVSDGGLKEVAVIAASNTPLVIGMQENRRVGRLFVVDSGGRAYQWSSSYVDKYGFRVALPTTRYDKIVFLDSRSRIVGGIGLSKQEIQSIAAGFKDADIGKAAGYILPSELSTVFAAVEKAAGNVARAYRMSEDELRSLFSMSVAGMAGYEVQGIVDGILDVSQEDEVFSDDVMRGIFGSVDVGSVDALMRGVSVVSNGDNGGTVLECAGVISNGDNGGTVLDCGVLVEGMEKVYVSLPDMNRIAVNAVCAGTFFMFQ